MITTLNPGFLTACAKNPNGPEEAILEDIAFQATNNPHYNREELVAIISGLWFAFVMREKEMADYGEYQ